jgi:hypothetical protein
MLLTTPVALFVYNRPQLTKKVFDVIAQARPPKLLVIGDGPRQVRADDDLRCAATRSIINSVDWKCEVLTDFSEINLGCKLRVSSGLNWVFKECEEAIILEDDCLPHPSFFLYCQELLERYRDDERVMVISGNNFQNGQSRSQFSYYFSRYAHIWGWASWQRAWHHYDVNMSRWSELRETQWLLDMFADKNVADYWTRGFDNVYGGHVDTWDSQWLFACWLQNALSILPNKNLVSNIGFGKDAVHALDPASPLAALPVAPMTFPLTHPPYLIWEKVADQFTFQYAFSNSETDLNVPYLKRLYWKIASFIRRKMRKVLVYTIGE